MKFEYYNLKTNKDFIIVHTEFKEFFIKQQPKPSMLYYTCYIIVSRLEINSSIKNVVVHLNVNSICILLYLCRWIHKTVSH